MADYILTPNMGLTEPIVGVTTGTNYATYINGSLTLLDQHDHSAGKGVQITPSGLNIDAALSFQANPATFLSYVNFTLQATSPTSAQTLYVKNGSETVPLPDLWYYDGNTQIQLTSNGQTATTLANLPGETYAGGTFTWRQGTGSTTPAIMDFGSIIIRPVVASTSNGVELISPNAANYDLTFPTALPSAQSLVTIDASGNIATPYNVSAGIPASAIQDNSLSDTQIAPQGISAASIANNTITGTQIVTNVSLNGGNVQTGTGSIVTGPGNIGNSPRIAWGNFDSGGGHISGQGITVSGHPSTGVYNISFSGTGFTVAPSVTGSCTNGGGAIVFVINSGTLTSAGFQCTLNAVGSGPTNEPFTCIAIGT